MNKEGSFKGIFIVMLISLGIAFFWEKLSWIRSSVNVVLNPTAGALLDWNLTGGMILIVLLIAVIMTFIQKYATDQKTLRELKKEQKEVQKQIYPNLVLPEDPLEIPEEEWETKFELLGLKALEHFQVNGVALEELEEDEVEGKKTLLGYWSKPWKNNMLLTQFNAEELELIWEKGVVVQANGDEGYEDQEAVVAERLARVDPPVEADIPQDELYQTQEDIDQAVEDGEGVRRRVRGW